jgi:D-alanyl-D-alanine carboxypeptidase
MREGSGEVGMRGRKILVGFDTPKLLTYRCGAANRRFGAKRRHGVPAGPAQRQQGELCRKADPDHPACDRPVPGARPQRKRAHQSEPGPRGKSAICRELIAAFIERAGGSVKGNISTGTVPEGLKPVYVHRQSRTLSKILAEMLRASNNYIANQVFLEIGGHRLGGPVSLEKSLKVADEMLAAHGLATAIHLEEGSGISRDNRFTARGLAKVLGLFAPHAGLLHGHDGGMNKTGTMDGIRTLAGYADTSSHGRVRFVISLTSNDDEMRFRLLRAIESGL